MALAPVPREKRHRFVLWGGKDSNLRPTDYESSWKVSVAAIRAWRGALSLRSWAEFGGVRDKCRDKVSAELSGRPFLHFRDQRNSSVAIQRLGIEQLVVAHWDGVDR